MLKRVLWVMVGLCVTTSALAQSDRARNWEFGLVVNNLSSESLSGQNGSFISTDGATGLGLSVNYNFSNRLSIGGDLLWNSPDYRAEFVPDDGIGIPQEIRHELDVVTFVFKGTFNFLEGPFTPFVEGSFGWTDFDSNIASSPPITGCWWDPWWGYICDTAYNTYSKTQETLGAAAGLRMDFRNGMTVKGSYGFLEFNTSNATEDANLDILRLDVIWSF